ncbi:MAG: hypothetical protein QM706_14965 [Nitrospira sp.]
MPLDNSTEQQFFEHWLPQHNREDTQRPYRRPSRRRVWKEAEHAEPCHRAKGQQDEKYRIPMKGTMVLKAQDCRYVR